MEYSTLLIFHNTTWRFEAENLSEGWIDWFSTSKDTLQKTESAWKGPVLAEDMHQTETNVWCLWKADMNQIFNVWVVQVTKKN